MSNPFDASDMAAGYARSRPAVHVHIIDRLRSRLGLAAPVERALDIGCGAGLSTAVLRGHARHLAGIDPSLAMLRYARTVIPDARFVCAAAESLPVAARSIDLMTAAGSLNWVDLPRFFDEVDRGLAPEGTLAIYDFAPGREFPDDDRLSIWFAEFAGRYPPAPARAIVPESLDLAPHRLRLREHEPLVVGLTIDPGFYLDYVMTETNVAQAVANGASRAGIREWCQRTLAPIFPVSREVLFRAYLALVGHDPVKAGRLWH